MKIEKKAIISANILTLVILSGCNTFEKMSNFSFSNNKKSTTTVTKTPKKKKIVKISPETIMDSIIEGINSSNYSEFSKRFDENLKKSLNEKKFNLLKKGLEKTLGNYKSRTYLGSLKKGPFTVYIWKSRFSKLKENEMVIYLTLGKLDKKIKVFDFIISNS